MSLTAPHFVLVDDHALFRMGLGQMLAAHWPAVRFHEAVSWAGALAQLKALWAGDRPDALLLDVGLPDADALPLLGQIHELAPGLPVLVMSADSRPERVAQARDAGVKGWVSKSAQPDVIISAVTTVMAGGRCFPGIAYDATPSPSARAGAAEPEALSDLQRQILQMLGHDMPNKAIARQLGLSETEVRVQVSWLTEMLQASSRREAYAHAVERGVLAP